MTVSDFENGYWYLDQLKRFAERIGIPAAKRLRKDELEKAIVAFLERGKGVSLDLMTSPHGGVIGLSAELVYLSNGWRGPGGVSGTGPVDPGARRRSFGIRAESRDKRQPARAADHPEPETGTRR
jgi:hypothetical protein